MRKFKKFAQSRWHSIPLGAMAIALVAALLVTGTVFALTTIGSWNSPNITVTTKPLLSITSDLGTTDFSKYTGAVIPVIITIYNPASEAYSDISTKMMVTKDSSIEEFDVKLEQLRGSVWVTIPLVHEIGNPNMLSYMDITSPIPAWGTDVTEFRITFNTAGVYHADALLTNP